MDAAAAAALLAASEEGIARVMEAYNRMGDKADFDEALGGLLRQMLSKEVLLAPLRSILSRYPLWLSVHRDRLTGEQYEQRGRQYQCFQRLVLVYETEPANFAKLASLMQEASTYGPPPGEIVSEIAPGVALGADGAPALRGLPPLPGSDCAVA